MKPFANRDSPARFVAYVPPGSIARSEWQATVAALTIDDMLAIAAYMAAAGVR